MTKFRRCASFGIRISNQKMDANTLEIACHTCISLQVWGGLFPLEPLNPHMPHELRLTRAFRHTLLWGLTSCEIHGSNQLINAKSQGSDFQHQSTIVHSHDMQLSDCPSVFLQILGTCWFTKCQTTGFERSAALGPSEVQ